MNKREYFIPFKLFVYNKIFLLLLCIQSTINISGQNNYRPNQLNNYSPSLNDSRQLKNWGAGTGARNTKLEEQYNFIATTQQEGIYWILTLRDSSNTIRMKGSYIDQELSYPEGMFYYYHSNGNTSMYGMYQSGQRNGIWISNYANNKLKDSISYSIGKKNGSFKRFHLNGTVFISGNYLDDNMHGTWREYYQNTQLASVSEYFQNRITKVVYYTQSGEKIEQVQNKLSTKFFFNHRLEIEKELINAVFYGSPHKMPNGNIECILYNMEGKKAFFVQWSDPALTKKAGLFEQFDTTGILRLSCYYDYNQMSGTLKAWYETGIMSDSGSMKKNMKDGIWESWYQTGHKKDSGAYVNNLPKDLWSHWDENGQTRTIGSYGKNGKIGDWKTYDRSGKILYIQRFHKSGFREPEKIFINQN